MTDGVTSRIGLGLLALFLVMSAARDVFFGWVFQSTDVFAVTALVFMATAMIFGGLTLRERGRWRGSLRHLRTILAVNVLTAAAWLAYLWAVKLIEPAVASTIWSGVGPLVVAALAVRASSHGTDRSPAVAETFTAVERVAYLGLLTTLVFMAVVAGTGHSGIAAVNPWRTTAGIALAAGSGAAIAVAILGTKRLHDAGFSARQVVALRFCLLIAVAGVVAIPGFAGDGSAAAVSPGGDTVGVAQRFADAARLIPAGLLLIALPIYALQAAVERLRPMTVEIIAALGPPLVFALQVFDGRIQFSPLTFAGVVSYSLCTSVAVLGRLVPLTQRATSVLAPSRRRANTGSAEHQHGRDPTGIDKEPSSEAPAL